MGTDWALIGHYLGGGRPLGTIFVLFGYYAALGALFGRCACFGAFAWWRGAIVVCLVARSFGTFMIKEGC